MSKSKKLLIAVLSVVLGIAVVAGAVIAIIVNKTDKTEFSFNENLTAEYGVEYNPQIKVGKKVGLISVKVVSADGEPIVLGAEYAFTPNAFTEYTYTVETEKDGIGKTYYRVVSVFDRSAPQILSALEDKTAELGIYSAFEADAAEFEITDNYASMAKYIVRKTVEISKGDRVYSNEEGYKEFLLDETGVYAVKVSFTDLYGNTSYGEYKINAVDTTAPVIECFPENYAWAENGKIAVPHIAVKDFSEYNYTVKAYCGNAEREISNGRIQAETGERIVLKINAEDVHGNKSEEKISYVTALEKGKLYVGAHEGSEKLFSAKKGIIEFYAGVSLIGDDKSDGLEWKNFAYAFGDISEFAGIAVDVTNRSDCDGRITIAAKRNGKTIYIGAAALKTASEGKVKYVCDISRFALSNVDGWAFEIRSDGAVNLTINEISLVKEGELSALFALSGSETEIAEAADGLPAQGGGIRAAQKQNAEKTARTANEIDFEDEAFFNFANIIGGGLSRNENAKFVSQGNVSARAELSAKVKSGVVFANPLTVKNRANYVTADIYSESEGNIAIELLAGNTAYHSGTLKLVRGWNQIGFVAGGVNNDLQNKQITGIMISNGEKYGNRVYLDNVNFVQISAASDELIFSDVAERETERMLAFIVPNVIGCDLKLIDGISVTIGGGELEKIDCSIGEEVNPGDIAAGDYEISYTVTDVFGAVHEKTVALHVKPRALYGEIRLSDYRAGESFVLPDPVIGSETFTAAELENAEVRKYYKEKGGAEWIEAQGKIGFSKLTDIEIRYTVTLGEKKILLGAETFIHANGVHIDFEKYSGGDYLGWGRNYGGENDKYPSYVSTDWSHDGTHSVYLNANPNYINSSGIILGEQGEEYPSFELGLKADAVILWIYSEADRHTNSIWIDNYDWKWATGELNIKKGEHRYVIPLSREIERIKRITFETNKLESFYFDSISFVRLAEIDFPDIDGREYYRSVEVQKPALKNASELAFTKAEIAAAKYTVTAGGTEYRFGADKIEIELAPGEYKVTFCVEIAGIRFTAEKSIRVRAVNCTFIAPRTAYESGKAYEIELPSANEEGIIFEAFVRKAGAEDWQKLPIKDGAAELILSASGNYELKIRAAHGEAYEEEIYPILVRSENTIADFEMEEDGTHHGARNLSSGNTTAAISSEWAYDGNYSVKMTTTYSADWAGIKFYDENDPAGALKFSKPVNAIGVRIYASRNLNDRQLEVLTSAGWVSAQAIDVKAGEGLYTFVLKKAVTEIKAISFYVESGKPMYVDTIRALTLNVSAPTIRETAYVNEEFSFAAPSLAELPENAELSVKYKIAGEESYTSAEQTNGKYVFRFDRAAMVEIVIEIVSPEYTKKFVYSVRVIEKAQDPSVGDIDWD